MGVPGAFPPLAGRVPEILAAKDGKNYLIAVVLNGLQGEIMAKGQKYNGVMPSFAQLKDEEIAAVLTHIATQWGNKLPQGTNFTAADVKAARGTKLTPAQVAEMRKKLGLK